MKRHPRSRRFDVSLGRRIDSVVICHIFRGGGCFVSDSAGMMTVRPNMLVVQFPGVRHFWNYDTEREWDGEWLELDPTDALPILHAAGITPSSPCRRFNGLPSLSARFNEMMEESRKTGEFMETRLAAMAFRIVAEIASNWRYGTVCDCALSERSIVEDAKCRLAAAGPKSIGVGEVARMSGCSASRFRRLFTEEVGISPKRFQLKIRIGRSCRLLVSTRMSVTAIAETCGFDSLYVFSRQFRRSMGCAPLEYRRSRGKVKPAETAGRECRTA